MHSALVKLCQLCFESPLGSLCVVCHFAERCAGSSPWGLKFPNQRRCKIVPAALELFRSSDFVVQLIFVSEILRLLFFFWRAVIARPDGRSYPKKFQVVTIHYTATTTSPKGDGSMVEFDSTHKRGKPLTFRLGAEQVIPGLEEGVAQVQFSLSRLCALLLLIARAA